MERNATQGGLERTPPSPAACPAHGVPTPPRAQPAACPARKLPDDAVPDLEQEVVDFAGADGDAEMAGKADGGAVAHEDARLEESALERVGMIANAREDEIGLRGRRGCSALGHFGEKARALGQDEMAKRGTPAPPS